MQHDHIQNFYPLIQTTGWGSACREKICACMVLYAPFPVICYATWPCSKKVEFRPIDPTPRVEMGVKGEVCRQNICDHVAAFQIPFLNLICNMTMFWKSWIWPKDPIPGGGGGWGEGVRSQNICYRVAVFRDYPYLICNNDHVLKKVEFWPIDPIPRDVGGGLQSKYLGPDVDAFLTPINLICNMTMKKLSNPSI